MRTTLTIDEDVAVELARLRRTRHISLKALVNDALRRGLREMNVSSGKSRTFHTRAFDMGKQLINLDKTVKALARLEGEGFK